MIEYRRNSIVRRQTLDDHRQGDIVIVAQDDADALDRIKEWIEEDWQGFKEVDLEKLSRAISEIRYNKKGRTLDIEFAKRGTYRYHNVPSRVVERFLSSRSKGDFFNDRIQGKYTYRRIASINRKVKIAKKLSRACFIGRILAKEGISRHHESINC